MTKNLDAVMQRIVEKLHEEFDQVVHPLSPGENKRAYDELEKFLSAYIDQKRDYWAAVHEGQHIEGGIRA